MFRLRSATLGAFGRVSWDPLSILLPSLVGFRGIADTISHEVAADMRLEKVGKDGLPGRVALDGSFQIRGTLFWSPYNKDPTIRGTYYIRAPYFGKLRHGRKAVTGFLAESGICRVYRCPESSGVWHVHCSLPEPQVPCKGVSHSWLRHTADGQNPALP